ncbi:hypothetical protein NQZ68_006143 [Dissostichus eleginoides]|nr:hypothetical protein NQZ68_006143 [Dissostichus eleginoides]
MESGEEGEDASTADRLRPLSMFTSPAAKQGGSAAGQEGVNSEEAGREDEKKPSGNPGTEGTLNSSQTPLLASAST